MNLKSQFVPQVKSQEAAEARALVSELHDGDSDDESDADDSIGEEEFLVNGRATKYQAELRVLDGIAAPRKSLAKEGVSLARAPEEKPWLTPAEADLERRLRPDYQSMTKAQLESFRPEIPMEEAQTMLEVAIEHANVNTLPRLPPKAESSTGLIKVKEMSKSRQIRHDEALRTFKDRVATISDELETRVIEKGRELRDKLEEIDNAIRKVVLELRDEQSLRMQDYEYVCNAWSRLESLCAQRKNAILGFDAELAAVEDTRTARTGKELSLLVENLVSISYRLRGEIARLAEREAHEINLVVINNMKIKKDLTARMLKHQVAVFHTTKAHWEKSETRWRFLRHERALDEWIDLMNSTAFCDPIERKEAIELVHESLRNRHEYERLECIAELQRLVPAFKLDATENEEPVPLSLPELTVDRIEETRQRLATLDEADRVASEELASTLEEHQHAMRSTMEQTREALRAELHEYAALADEGDIFTQGERGKGALHRLRIHELMSDESLDNFFRRAGGLKAELTNIVTSLAMPELIHNKYLETVLHRVELLVEARQVSQVHENEGKTSDLKALQTTLEKLRIGAAADLGPLVPVLHRQAKLLHATVSSLGDFLCSDILTALRHLEEVDPKLKEPEFDGARSDNGEQDIQAETSHTGDDEDDDDAANGLLAQESHVTRQTSAEYDDEELQDGGPDPDSAELAYKAKPLNLADLRAAQKILGTVISVSGLPSALCDELEHCRDTLRIQMNVNSTVDEIIHSHCEDRIGIRETELQAYRENLAGHTYKQNAMLSTNMSSLCDFMVGIARILREARENEEKMDVHFENALDQLADQFEDDDGQREAQFSEATDRLRHAPDKASLQESFEDALQILAEIDAGYRRYHKDGVRLSREHPRRAHHEATEQHCRVAAHFGFLHIGENGEPIALDNAQIAAEDENAETATQGQDARSAEVRTNDQDSDGAATEKSDEQDPINGSEPDGSISADTTGGDLSEEQKTNADLVSTGEAQEVKAGRGENGQGEGDDDDISEEEKDGEEEQDQLLHVVLNSQFAFAQQMTTADLAASILKPPPSESCSEEDDFEDGESETRSLTDADLNEEDQENDESGDAEKMTTEGGGGEEEENNEAKDTTLEDDENDADGENAELEDHGKVDISGRDGTGSGEESKGADDLFSTRPELCACPPTPVWPSLHISLDHVVPLVETVRNAVLKTTCEFRASRKAEMDKLCVERCEDYTEELEERLRLHWPRKGRTDVKFQQPRAGELLQHQQRHDRHVRAVQMKNKYQGQQFARKTAKVKEALRKFKQFMNGLRLHLEAQSNAAALQGLAKKAKDAAASFKTAMDDEKEAMMPFVRRNNDLLDMNRQFLATCAPFETGGDYNRDEIEIERHMLSLVEETLLRDIQVRAEELQELFALIRDTRVTLSTELASDFERCLQALSVREGLGRKYGAPRRKAQERLRSETARSKNAEAFIDNLLRELAELIKIDLADAEQDEETHSLALRIKLVMDALRKCMWRRAKYLEAFKDADACPEPAQCALQDTSGEETIEGMDEDALAAAMGTTANREATFSAVLEEAETQCRKDTTELYEAEGMMSELLESGKRLTPDGELLPESLVKFLLEFQDKGRQTQVEASRHLRSQIERAQELFIEAPAVVLGNLVARAQRNGAYSQEALETPFEDFYRRSERMRLGHRELLRPVLGDPNHKADLLRVCESEEKRLGEARERMIETHSGILQGLKAEAGIFAEALRTTSGCLLELLDGMVLPTDIRTLPGDDEVVTKRMGLRKLRKARLKAEAGEDEKADSGNAGDGEEVRGLTRKTWPVLHCTELRMLQNAFQALEMEGSMEAEPDVEARQSSREVLVESIETINSVQHRSVVLERHRAYDAFVAWFRETSDSVDKKFRTLYHDEDRWAAYWTEQLAKLTAL
ncbi:Coiled-coil domain-containing protein 180 [Hondaea fermentalgiana]|uniref:Coiled-coil domain-containing protein 180 n=1 Tax=Hondaea fermentalgiana TaxID=2315210 RepID=A0A2R5GC29_9STRA|nr:Coiled-coil domain-containing protein 180 [Hondaea fermentalgiana]|eukprot:GBG27268.1 Coiled-coil domain-containing protein 180 [Hondaea fermentalgiana]